MTLKINFKEFKINFYVFKICFEFKEKEKSDKSFFKSHNPLGATA